MSKGRVIGLRTTEGGVNPKDRIGATKIDMTTLPVIGLAETAFCMMDGAHKYGPYNWRIEPVLARTYIAAAIRHLEDWLDGEERAEDSLGHHLGHAASCCLILMDAQRQGKLVDDRLIQNEGFDNVSKVFEDLNAKLRQRNIMYHDREEDKGDNKPALAKRDNRGNIK